MTVITGTAERLQQAVCSLSDGICIAQKTIYPQTLYCTEDTISKKTVKDWTQPERLQQAVCSISDGFCAAQKLLIHKNITAQKTQSQTRLSKTGDNLEGCSRRCAPSLMASAQCRHFLSKKEDLDRNQQTQGRLSTSRTHLKVEMMDMKKLVGMQWRLRTQSRCARGGL